MALIPNTAFSALTTLSADQMNLLPWGVVTEASNTATTSFSAGTTLTVFTKTFTVQPGRIYLIFGRLGVQVTGAAATSNALWVDETTLGSRTLAYQTAAITQFFCQSFSGFVYVTSTDFGVSTTAASKTVNLKWRCGASGQLNANPDAIVGANTLHHQLLILDVAQA